MSIICGTTLAPENEQANQAAAALSLLLGDELHLVHVVDELGAELALTEEYDTLYEPAGRHLRGEADDLRQLGIQIEPELAAGAWHAELPRIAMHHRARLIVLSPHPGVVRKRPSPWAAVRIARAAPIPVMLVRHADGLLRWAQERAPLRVLIALGCCPGSRAALRWIAELRSGGPCEAWLAYVSRMGGVSDASAEISAHPYRSLPPFRCEPPLDEVEAFRDELRRLGVSVTKTSVQDASVLEDLAQREAIDLVVVPRDLPRGHLWPRWVWHSLFRAAVPGVVVCVPPDDAAERVRPAGPLSELVRHPPPR
ncbi:universal stress protein [Polyangium fumosum]|uniref:universal stress protein n=1 Tax=Polyangium fumosum TaxID=889272 RepID=UPI0014795328|nr:universal stress protein [Polyangium fumosum]